MTERNITQVEAVKLPDTAIHSAREFLKDIKDSTTFGITKEPSEKSSKALIDQGVLPDVAFATADSKLIELLFKPTKEEQALADKYGAKVTYELTPQGPKAVYYVENARGEKVKVAVAEKLEDAEKQLQKFRDDKIDELEKKFDVDIKREGELMRGFRYGSAVPARDLNLTELIALESALYKSQPSNYARQNGPLQIGIARDDQSAGADGYFWKSEPNAAPTVEAEPNVWKSGAVRMENVWMHELAHNGQDKLFGGDRQKEDEYGRALGFVRNPKNDGWLLKSNDNPPRYYSAESDGWYRTNENGKYVDKDGREIEDKEKRNAKVSADEVKKHATVKPFTDYFVNPLEMGAETLLNFRVSQDVRGKMLRDNPQLYEIAKKLDQDETNKTFGTKPDGQPLWLRRPDGQLVANDDKGENAKRIAQWEQDMKNSREKSFWDRIRPFSAGDRLKEQSTMTDREN